MTDDMVHANRMADLVGRLDSLVDGEAAAARLVACGRAAVEPLRHFLLDSLPRGVPQPRCWAVQALAGVGAKDVLIEYLTRDDVATDPVVKLAEEAVQRAAALALAEWHTDESFDVLLMLTIRRPIAGVIEALGRFERRDAVPVLLHALEDDCCRPFAEAALARTALRDRDLLIRSALLPLPVADDESASSLRRRRVVLELLRGVPLASDECHRIAPLIESADVELAIGAAALAIANGSEADQQRARQHLWVIAPNAPWHLYHDVQSLLPSAAPRDAERR